MDISLPLNLEEDGLQVEQFVEVASGWQVTFGSHRRIAACPNCGELSRHIHSYYLRQVADLPGSGRTVTLCLRVRRFHCQRAYCRRRLFTERLPGIVSTHARRTEREQACLLALAQSSGAKGAHVWRADWECRSVPTRCCAS